mmetsp:Transcript_13494/g.33084  ORF Transcript_13494/g.33084 Transcript_13494/m.33084 type:complete len:244 (+) Transcript_13494:432-1163(+)
MAPASTDTEVRVLMAARWLRSARSSSVMNLRCGWFSLAPLCCAPNMPCCVNELFSSGECESPACELRPGPALPGDPLLCPASACAPLTLPGPALRSPPGVPLLSRPCCRVLSRTLMLRCRAGPARPIRYPGVCFCCCFLCLAPNPRVVKELPIWKSRSRSSFRLLGLGPAPVNEPLTSIISDPWFAARYRRNDTGTCTTPCHSLPCSTSSSICSRLCRSYMNSTLRSPSDRRLSYLTLSRSPM